MNEALAAEEKAYWTEERRRRSAEFETARASGDLPHVLAAARIRLREADERLAGMSD